MSDWPLTDSSDLAGFCKVHYWQEGQRLQNFGDYLSEFFLNRLFLPARVGARGIHLLGSVLDDMFVPEVDDGIGPVVFWGCGLRAPDGLSPDRQARARILAVRGPLSRSCLRLGAHVPIGDPGFLLPALYQPKAAHLFHGAAICIPHFLDGRDDEALLARSGCDMVLRPAIAATMDAVETFIDAIVASEFVLTASLHGAVVAAAYGKPFAFWDAGVIDVPFKWEDLAASMRVVCAFQVDLSSGRAWHETAQATLTLPEVWRLLLEPPLPLRQSALAQVVSYYAGQGEENNRSLRVMADEFRSRTAAVGRLAKQMAQSIHDADVAYHEREAASIGLAQAQAALQTEKAAGAALEQALHTAGGTLRAAEQALQAAEQARVQEAERHRLEQEMTRQRLDDERAEMRDLERRLAASRDDLARAVTSSQADMSDLRHERDVASAILGERDGQIHVISAELAGVYASTSWRVTRLPRAFAGRHPGPARILRRAAKLVWWTITGQLRRRLRQRAAIMAEVRAAHALSTTGPSQPALPATADLIAVAHPAPVSAPTSIGLPLHFANPHQPKAVFVDSRYPRVDRDSGSVDSMNMIRILQSFGYEVAFIATAEFHEINAYGKALQQSGVVVVTSAHCGSVTGFFQKYGRQLTLGVLSRVTCGGHFIDDMRRLAPQARVIFNTVDLHHIRLEREAALTKNLAVLNEAYQTEERERYLIRMADCTFVVSSFDQARCRELVPGAEVVLMPIVRKIPGRQSGFEQRSGIGFIGGFEHKPNLDAVHYFLDEIWPLLRKRIPDITFSVIGADMPASLKDIKRPGVEMVGFVPELDPWLNRLRLTVAPLRYGAGAKGKVVSSFSFGVPCVMSDIAAEGMGIDGEASALLAKDPETYVDTIARLYENADAWLSLSDACLDIVDRQNSLEHGRKIFEKVLAGLGLAPETLKDAA